jgi:FtsZ-binding cell division protein ZapB
LVLPSLTLLFAEPPRVAEQDRSESLRNEVQELKEEAAALADRAKKAARHAEVLVERIKHLETQIAKTS